MSAEPGRAAYGRSPGSACRAKVTGQSDNQCEHRAVDPLRNGNTARSWLSRRARGGTRAPVARPGGYDGELSMRVAHDGDARIVLTGALDQATCQMVHDALVAVA